MSRIYDDIRSQHPVDVEKLKLSRDKVKIKDISPDYIGFWNTDTIDQKYKVAVKTLSLSNPVTGKIVKLNYSVSSKKLWIHSEWFWKGITFSELDRLAKANKYSFVSFPIYLNYKEKLLYFKQLGGCIPLDYGFYTKTQVIFDSLPDDQE